MPRNYKRKTTRGDIPPDVMERAARKVADVKKSLRDVAKDFEIGSLDMKLPEAPLLFQPVENIAKQIRHVNDDKIEFMIINQLKSKAHIIKVVQTGNLLTPNSFDIVSKGDNEVRIEMTFEVIFRNISAHKECMERQKYYKRSSDSLLWNR
ncbi:Hypothetical predicted protein [Octopus vulgaris]|uniref:Uncharacterized protein n=1 Tax=Octopus vulgaris TaxID=6645 RepID=A0AA36AQJ1_OCTVU|nr:Hypothetical predicted protein [Octopus vulgaris]